ncbi:hypothetical protein AMATHDRAFT_72945 [Amanita thiersii Skay4041]|uniref:Phospholipase n=1 Tax=Amanita thiersii Skay4041 TaxID=703135 RepID=A0A2A9NTP2_9AGAR|nr:hypothetical protein AMATHDRAFT_72945 [Amanita thiersii Skay4041]
MSAPHTHHTPLTARAKWGRLRSLLPHLVQHAQPTPGPSAVAPNSVNMTDELITGGLSTLMLRLWFERDEKGQRRIPILFHRLRIHISDSLHPMHFNKSIFRIECEYANGAARWVIYRQLRDFLSLHTHYTVSNVYNRNVSHMPEFPKTSLPYLRFLKKEGHQVTPAEFARIQRESLEDYLLRLIRAVMFHPASNRLAAFLEISSLFISLAQSGGVQYKAGLLKIESVASGGGGFGRKSTTWRERREYRWCAVRESYLVVLDEPGESTIWDVFLIDSDFSIERPKRYYRQGLNLLHVDSDSGADKDHGRSDPEGKSLLGSIRVRVSSAFSRPRSESDTTHGRPSQNNARSSPSVSSLHEVPPMLDPSTHANPLAAKPEPEHSEQNSKPGIKSQNGKQVSERDVSKHTFYIINSQMKLKLYARNERQMQQWITAFEKVAAYSHYIGKNRFDSFAPIRLNVAAQWLVDGRDYFWNLSRAILLAKECIYIHGWWLSPELQMRRPNKDHYRLDHLLERKAKEGVKICVILYQEVSNRTTPTDSNYTKQRLTSLHPNILVQRSPSHFQTGTFYWAHHEKLCVIDHAIAFMGGVDLCFGRWDTPQHVLTDDVEDTENPQIWPGKDYSNPRLCDFYELHKPDEDMYDRSRVPRMPWHDVAMQIVGQPARDLARHFVQRWNWLLRIKNHSRTMSFLLPPPEFKEIELTQMGLTGTCELQICRSAGPWSMGTPGRIEHSIQNAYLKAIQMSEHFVYIENQFFITSTVVNDIKIENRIGDALVHRIIRAHRSGTQWKCCIVIPLLPGFTFPVDHSDASAIRIILECQNRTLCRGPNSIFYRLRREGIDPDNYITVFSLRNWAKLRGDVLTTEQVYIHGKVCVVDDRLAIIGSANINERSQRGDRDSEIAAIIRDTDMIDGTMAGRPFKVGRFAHTLRVRLMREHLGVDVDGIDEESLVVNQNINPTSEEEAQGADAQQANHEAVITQTNESEQRTCNGSLLLDEVDGPLDTSSTARQIPHKACHTAAERVGDSAMDEERRDMHEHKIASFSASDEKYENEDRKIHRLHNGFTANQGRDDNVKGNEERMQRSKGNGETRQVVAGEGPITDDNPVHPLNHSLEESVSRSRTLLRRDASKIWSKSWFAQMRRPAVDPQGFEDPVTDNFWKDVWVASAVYNTEIYRKVFHAIPDDCVTTWKQYKEFVMHHERLNKPARDSPTPDVVGRIVSESLDVNTLGQDATANQTDVASFDELQRSKEGVDDSQESSNSDPKQKTRKPVKGAEPFEKWERDEMEKLLNELNGHLVLYPTRFLEGEDIANNFLFNADRLLPLPIYN